MSHSMDTYICTMVPFCCDASETRPLRYVIKRHSPFVSVEPQARRGRHSEGLGFSPPRPLTRPTLPSGGCRIAPATEAAATPPPKKKILSLWESRAAGSERAALRGTWIFPSPAADASDPPVGRVSNRPAADASDLLSVECRIAPATEAAATPPQKKKILSLWESRAAGSERAALRGTWIFPSPAADASDPPVGRVSNRPRR